MIAFPDYIYKLPQGPNRDIAITRFGLKLAAIYATEEGSLKAFADALGISHTMVKEWSAGRQRVSAQSAIAIEKLVGRHIIQREVFRPDLFLIEG